MSTPPSDDEPFAGERALRADVHAAIERALSRTLESRDRDITRVEEEKLAFLLIDEFNLDLTYSWYITGADIKLGDNTVSTGPTGPTGPSLTDDEQRVDFGGVSAQVDDDRVQTFTDYLAAETLLDDYELQDVWYTQRHEFLHDFYDEFAPDEYEEAYFASTEIRRRLANLDEKRNRQAQNATLSDFGGSERPLLPSSDEEEFRHTVSELHFALARNEDLSETTESVTVGTDLIERTLNRLTRVQPSTDEQWELIEELPEFFFYTVWRLPALVMSIQTAQGPNAGELRVQHGQKLDGFEDEMQRKHDNLRDRLTDADLLPTLEEDRSSDINLTYKISLSDG